MPWLKKFAAAAAAALHLRARPSLLDSSTHSPLLTDLTF